MLVHVQECSQHEEALAEMALDLVALEECVSQQRVQIEEQRAEIARLREEQHAEIARRALKAQRFLPHVLVGLAAHAAVKVTF